MTTDKQITLEMVPLSAIHPYAHNAKKHPNYQIEQIKASIQQFGNNDPCLYGWKPGASHYFVSDFSQSTILESQLETKSKRELIALIKTYQANQPTSILRVNRPTKNEEHPTMKPIALLERFIRSSSRRGDCVLDTFAGSGSTLLACERLGRKSYSMELEPKYVERILTRFQQETGQAPIKLNKEE